LHFKTEFTKFVEIKTLGGNMKNAFVAFKRDHRWASFFVLIVLETIFFLLIRYVNPGFFDNLGSGIIVAVLIAFLEVVFASVKNVEDMVLGERLWYRFMKGGYLFIAMITGVLVVFQINKLL
jgi:hypothetical protein